LPPPLAPKNLQHATFEAGYGLLRCGMVESEFCGGCRVCNCHGYCQAQPKRNGDLYAGYGFGQNVAASWQFWKWIPIALRKEYVTANEQIGIVVMRVMGKFEGVGRRSY